MNNVGFMPLIHWQSAFLKQLQHRAIFRQDLGNELANAPLFGDVCEMAHQQGADAPSLIIVDDKKRQLRLAWLHEHVAPATNDRWMAAFVNQRNQGNVLGEIDINEEIDLLFGELSSGNKEPAIEGAIAGSSNDGSESMAVLRF